MVFLWFSPWFRSRFPSFNGAEVTEPQGSGAEARAVAQGWAAQIEAFGDSNIRTGIYVYNGDRMGIEATH